MRQRYITHDPRDDDYLRQAKNSKRQYGSIKTNMCAKMSAKNHKLLTEWEKRSLGTRLDESILSH